MRFQTTMSMGLILAALSAPSAVAAALRATQQAETAATIAPTTAQDVVQFSVYLPLRHQQQLEALVAQLHDQSSPQYHQWLQPDDFIKQFGPSASDIASVRAALVARGLTVLSSNEHGLKVRGSAGTVAQVFAAPLRKVVQNGHAHFQARRSLQLPGELSGIELRVVGLEAVPQHRVHARVLGQIPAAGVDSRNGPTGPYWFDDLKQAYDYPAYSARTDGSGVSVAVLMSDLIYPDDLRAMFDHEKFTAITGKAAPSVNTVLVDGGGVTDGYGSLEASLDVQQVLGGAPGAAVTLVSVPDLSDDSLIDGYTAIVDANKYDIVNSSFGGCELAYSAAWNGGTDYTSILKTYHEIFLQGNAQGITFVASSGDEAGLECPSVDYLYGGTSPVFQVGVSTPAADPAVTSVGGGNLVTTAMSGSLNSTYVRESANADPEAPYDIYGLGVDVSGGYWGAGGGVSTIFAKPAYQALVNTGSNRFRTLPDVGMQVGGCPQIATSCDPDDSSVVTAYGVGVGGAYYAVIGTSVASPEFVGAIALFEQQLGKRNHRLGNANTYLYALGALQSLAGGQKAPSALQFYHRGMAGYNGVHTANTPSYNYNYVYGNGSPDVRKLFAMTGYPAAGVPQTASNP